MGSQAGKFSIVRLPADMETFEILKKKQILKMKLK